MKASFALRVAVIALLAIFIVKQVGAKTNLPGVKQFAASV